MFLLNRAEPARADYSLKEAIFASAFQSNKAIDPVDTTKTIATGCTAADGNDTIVLTAGAAYQVSGIVNDPYNLAGIAADPRVVSTLTIEGRGARLERVGARAAACAAALKQSGAFDRTRDQRLYAFVMTCPDRTAMALPHTAIRQSQETQPWSGDDLHHRIG